MSLGRRNWRSVKAHAQGAFRQQLRLPVRSVAEKPTLQNAIESRVEAGQRLDLQHFPVMGKQPVVNGACDQDDEYERAL